MSAQPLGQTANIIQLNNLPTSIDAYFVKAVPTYHLTLPADIRMCRKAKCNVSFTKSPPKDKQQSCFILKEGRVGTWVKPINQSCQDSQETKLMFEGKQQLFFFPLVFSSCVQELNTKALKSFKCKSSEANHSRGEDSDVS